MSAGTVRSFVAGTSFTLHDHSRFDGGEDAAFTLVRLSHLAHNNLDADTGNALAHRLGRRYRKNMLIYKHHTCGDMIDIDDRTGRWVPVEEDDDPIMVGQMPIAMRADFAIRGSYTIENDKHYCFYWNDEGELVFRADDRRFCLFRRAPGGGLVDLEPGLVVELQQATYGDGRAMPNMSIFTLTNAEGERLVEVLYDSECYLQYYLGNVSFVPDEDLSDWDFFVAVKRGVEELKLLAAACTVPAADRPRPPIYADELVTVETGKSSPRGGIWAAVHHLDRRCRLETGEVAPDIDGRCETWVWVGA